MNHQDLAVPFPNKAVTLNQENSLKNTPTIPILKNSLYPNFCNDCTFPSWYEFYSYKASEKPVGYKTVLYALIRDGFHKGESSQLYIAFAQGYEDKYGHDLKNHYEPNKGQSLVASIDPEPLQRYDLLSTEYQGLVRDAYEKEYISITKAAEMLGLDLTAMRKLHSSWEYEADEQASSL